MTGKVRIAAVLGAVLLAILAAGIVKFGIPFVDGSAQKIALGRSVYATQCSKCHGKTLEGQPDWQTPLPSGRLPAPPHDASGHTWHHSDDMLFGITKHGLKPYVTGDYESDMPAFATTLSDQEITAVIEFIKSTWSNRESDYQREITRQTKQQQ